MIGWILGVAVTVAVLWSLTTAAGVFVVVFILGALMAEAANRVLRH